MTRCLATLLVLSASSSSAADWLGTAGQQPHESVLSPSNVHQLQLIWTYKLAASPSTPPLILGRWVTNRGTKELLLIGAGKTIYAIDADLGRLFWKRELPDQPACIGMAPLPPITSTDDEDDDEPQDLRPLIVRSAEGRLVALHPTDGRDIPLPPKASCDTRSHEQVIANGVTWSLKGKLLKAADTSTGRLLYSSKALVKTASATGIAIANGHVCFGTTDGTLYCFGFPVDQ